MRKDLMRKLLLFLLFWSQLAVAGWTYIDSTADKEDFYLDLDTLKVKGDLVTIWTYMNLPPLKKTSSQQSIALQIEFDCSKDRSRELYIASYTKPHLGGVASDRRSGNKKWDVVAPFTMEGKMFKYVCGNAPIDPIKELK